jgi:hypothetical protein
MRFLLVFAAVSLASAHELTVSGTRFLMDGKPFPYTGISFFNAIYNPAFNKSSSDRTAWLEKFKTYGINTLRIWAQWDSKRGFVDSCAECSLYYPDGRLRKDNVERLKTILADTDREGMAVELALFSQESRHDGIGLEPPASERALLDLTRELMSFRNVTFQIWNEFSELVPEHVRTIKSIDPKRLVSNSPGGSGIIAGDPAQQAVLDYLSPHTSRQDMGRPWQVAPAEVHYLLERYGKPVVDDEPARNGTPKFGGPPDRTLPYDHILQIWEVWKAGGYITYHHDMFQTGAGSPSVPPSGIPDPEFNPYHRAVLEFIAQRSRYFPEAAR